MQAEDGVCETTKWTRSKVSASRAIQARLLRAMFDQRGNRSRLPVSRRTESACRVWQVEGRQTKQAFGVQTRSDQDTHESLDSRARRAVRFAGRHPLPSLMALELSLSTELPARKRTPHQCPPERGTRGLD